MNTRYDTCERNDLMEFPERVSERAVNVISRYLDNASEEKLAEIKYGIAVTIANSYKIIILFALAFALNVPGHFATAFASFGLLRTFAAGVHAKREWTCLPASIIILFSIVYSGMTFSLNIYTISAVFCICFIIILKYAPADTEERPIVSSKLRRKLKYMSCLSLLLLYLISVYYSNTSTSVIITVSAVVESILILPITYKLTGNVYGAGINIKNKEV